MFSASPLIRIDCPLLKLVLSLRHHVIFHSRLSVCVSSLSLPPSVSLHSARFTETLSYKVSVSELAFITYTCGTSHCLVLTARLFWDNSTGEPHNMPHVCEEQCLLMFSSWLTRGTDTIIGRSLVSLILEADIQILFFQLRLLLRPGIENKVLNTHILSSIIYILL